VVNFLKDKIKFNRNEFAGCFGDIGTDFPLIVGIILASGIDVASALIMYGVMLVLTGIVYGLPMPVQPLKAMAVIVITQKLSGNILFGGGLAIGIIMFLLSISGLITIFAKSVPKNVVRGVQFGLGIQLSLLALKEYIPADGAHGYILAGLSFMIIIFLFGNRKFPAAPLVILLGLIYAFLFKINFQDLTQSVGMSLPKAHAPSLNDILAGLILLAIPQIPLSVCNSILATKQTVEDFFPEKKLSVKRIGLTYSLMNLINPFFGGIPVCHGSGGLAGHYTFGARTGGSVLMYGGIYLILGLFFSHGFQTVINLFPKPMLGIILVFEGLALMRLIQDVFDKKSLFIVFAVALIVVGLPYGYVIGLIVGLLLNRYLKF
jgi:hypothetical protein